MSGIALGVLGIICISGTVFGGTVIAGTTALLGKGLTGSALVGTSRMELCSVCRGGIGIALVGTDIAVLSIQVL